MLDSNVFIQWAEADQVFFIFKFASVVTAIGVSREKRPLNAELFSGNNPRRNFTR